MSDATTSINMCYRKVKYYSIHTSIEWSRRKDEPNIDGKIKEHDQWCRVRTRILGQGSGYCILPSKSITFIKTECYDST
jgi:hypothetical protein